MSALKPCQFCQKNAPVIDYKDVKTLRRHMNSQGKIYPPKRHGLCSSHQRALALAVKRARTMALVPFVIQ